MKYSAILSDTYPTKLSKEHLGWVVEENGNKYLITNSTTYLLKED